MSDVINGDPLFVPSSPRNLPLRPLKYGMIKNLPSQVAPLGSFNDLRSLLPVEGGLKRTPVFVLYKDDQGTVPDDLPMVNLHVSWNDDGEKNLVLNGSRHVYYVDPSTGITHIPWTYTPAVTGAVEESAGIYTIEFDEDLTGDNVVVDDDLWIYDHNEQVDGTLGADGTTTTFVTEVLAAAGTYVGWLVRINGEDRICSGYAADGTLTVREAFTAAPVTTDTYELIPIKKFTIVSISFSTPTTTIGFASPSHQYDTVLAGSSSTPELYEFTIERVIKSMKPYIVDLVPGVDGLTIFADDSNRGLIALNTKTDVIDLLNAAQDPYLTQITCVDLFADRLFIGGMNEDGVDHRNRVRWTDPTNRTVFPALNYIDLPETDGEIIRLKRLGSIHVAYFDNSIYIGRMTNYADLPVLYSQMDSGGVGLIGPRALCSWIDGHYFVGQDDIYFLSASLAVQPIGTPVLQDTIRSCKFPTGIQVVPDPQNERIIFGFPTSGEQISRLWSFCYKTKQWSYETIGCSMLAYTGDVVGVRVRDLVEEMRAYTEPVGSWRSAQDRRELFCATDGTLMRLSEQGTAHTLFGIPVVIAETNDIDLEVPDMIKTFNRLSIKIDRKLLTGESVVFRVSYSLNRGGSWTVLPRDATIGEGQDECRVNFLATGSMFRFRVESRVPVAPYTITEFVLRWRPRGLETSY